MAFNTDVDTMSYYFGMARADGFKNYLLQSDVDTAYIDDFFKGFREGIKHHGPKDIAYLEGMRVAHLINNRWIENLNSEIYGKDSTMSINKRAVFSGFYYGVKNQDDLQMVQAESISRVKIEQVKEKYRLEKYGDNLVANTKFLEENKLKEGVKTTESGLQYKIIKEGTGPVPEKSSLVKVNYRGRLIDGTEFDSSYKKDAPSQFRVSTVIKGWTEALSMMPVGSKWEIYIPYDIGYGSAGSGNNIPPYATLIFEVELLEIDPK
jgi:FKBP-type peptidyl-prolyl cis-trans isomerase FklB